jgi:hypothetical protein
MGDYLSWVHYHMAHGRAATLALSVKCRKLAQRSGAVGAAELIEEAHISDFE